MSQYRSRIKTCLQTITKSIKQIPQDKQAIIASRVNKVLQKYSNQQSNQSLQKFNKQLEFNLNFIKLSYPNINFNLQQPQPPQTQQATQNQQKEQNKNTQNNYKTKQQQSLHRQFALQNQQALKKQMKDISGIRQQVDFSNWSEGNVDPQNIKRHKQLLTRQHYGGDFWKGKQRPKMQSVNTLAQMMATMEPPKVTQKDLQRKQKPMATDPQKAFQKVKR